MGNDFRVGDHVTLKKYCIVVLTLRMKVCSQKHGTKIETKKFICHICRFNGRRWWFAEL